jgi:hypothetical protein
MSNRASALPLLLAELFVNLSKNYANGMIPSNGVFAHESNFLDQTLLTSAATASLLAPNSFHAHL